MTARIILTALVVALCGCHVAHEDIGRAPHLTPVGSGVAIERSPSIHRVSARKEEYEVGSIWQDRSAALFKDPRAGRVGDVVTVKIAIKDKASIDNASNRSRDAKSDLNGSFDFLLDAFGLQKKGSGNASTSVKGNTSTDSKGGITRSESIELLVAAVVNEVLPNGNLVISGSQEIRVNFEVRVLNVAGVIRPRDVAADNTIVYEKIAEARVSYGGRGRLTEIQQPGLGQQIGDIISPF